MLRQPNERVHSKGCGVQRTRPGPCFPQSLTPSFRGAVHSSLHFGMEWASFGACSMALALSIRPWLASSAELRSLKSRLVRKSPPFPVGFRPGAGGPAFCFFTCFFPGTFYGFHRYALGTQPFALRGDPGVAVQRRVVQRRAERGPLRVLCQAGLDVPGRFFPCAGRHRGACTEQCRAERVRAIRRRCGRGGAGLARLVSPAVRYLRRRAEIAGVFRLYPLPAVDRGRRELSGGLRGVVAVFLDLPRSGLAYPRPGGRTESLPGLDRYLRRR